MGLSYGILMHLADTILTYIDQVGMLFIDI